MTKMTETRDRGIGAPGVTKSGRSIGILVLALLCSGCTGCRPSDPQETILPPLARCPPSGFNTTVIELAETGGVCAAVTRGGDKFDTIWTTWGHFAYWEICNRCTQRVDIRLRRYSGTFTDDFQYTVPMAGASNEIELHNIGTYPSASGLIRGLLRSDVNERASRNYDVSWRPRGTTSWTDIDPRLEIERDHLTLLNRLIQELKGPSGGPGR
jgi:hypothetical protein